MARYLKTIKFGLEDGDVDGYINAVRVSYLIKDNEDRSYESQASTVFELNPLTTVAQMTQTAIKTVCTKEGIPSPLDPQLSAVATEATSGQ